MEQPAQPGHGSPAWGYPPPLQADGCVPGAPHEGFLQEQPIDPMGVGCYEQHSRGAGPPWAVPEAPPGWAGAGAGDDDDDDVFMDDEVNGIVNTGARGAPRRRGPSRWS